MVSTRPSPNPVRGRISYPTATTYIPGDAEAPTYINSEPVKKTTSRDSDRERAQGLKTWWKSFREGTEPKPVVTIPPGRKRGVFGVPLSESIEYASVQISTAGEEGALYVWGVIPVVVAKCGLYLKERATDVEGTFRISGSAKRMRELQAEFDSPPKYGKNIDWKPYTAHDVATIFRRFLTQMPESIIPFDFYQEFRQVIEQDLPTEQLISEYKSLIRAIPAINRYLLLYVLDLLHVFANNSDKNLMTAANLALIFQPGVLSHPIHAMRPRDHVLSQRVLEFMIDHQDHFLIGMESSKRRQPTPPLSPPTPSSPLPIAVKADDDLMLPSDSDDEAPAGGYYVVEGSSRRPQSSKAPTPLSPPTPPLSTSSATAANTRPAPARTVKSPPPVHEVMEASDSDDEAPPGGYEVRTSDPAQARATLLSRVKPRTNSINTGPKEVVSSRASSLVRRRTVPARLAGPTRIGLRRGPREAP